jgi:thymidylate synthase
LRQYLDLLDRILQEGEMVQTGAMLLSEQRKPSAKSLFAAQFRHDLAEGFPAVTTKRFYFESMVKELLWFLRGETNVKTLGCGIWSQWADPLTGECGPIYGRNWRRWAYPVPIPDGTDTEGNPRAAVEYFDQIGVLVAELKAVVADPSNRARRRLILTGWNPPDIRRMGLPPCHTMAQFLPVNGRLNCHCFWRSIDAFTGMPFNVAQYALLTHILAAISGLQPGLLVASVTDLHIYDNQFDAVLEQLTRKPLPLPRLVIEPDLALLTPDLSREQVGLLKPVHFFLSGYQGYSPLRAELAV